MKDSFEGKLFDVEHALGMYATSFCTLPAASIYDNDLIAHYKNVISRCHIYLIGLLPIVHIDSIELKDRMCRVSVSTQGNSYELEYEIPVGFNLKEADKDYYFENDVGEQITIAQADVLLNLKSRNTGINFEIKYIGQAYGKDGSRNAVDRLLKHETLQKISLKGIPEGFHLHLLLLELEPGNQLFTVFNPHASNKDKSDIRIKAGLDKLFNTSEEERITLFEASFIRYFLPIYNKEFKNSFPSTNLKVLQDCYDKDFCAIISEINFDELPFNLCSESVPPAWTHIAKFDLHEDSDRKAFFYDK
jgi:hypothetical protein